MYSCGLFWNYIVSLLIEVVLSEGFFSNLHPDSGGWDFVQIGVALTATIWPSLNFKSFVAFAQFFGWKDVLHVIQCLILQLEVTYITFHKVINHNSKKVTVNCQDIYIYIHFTVYIYIYKITCLFGVFTCALVGRLSMPLREVPVDSDMIQIAGGVNSKVGSFSSKCHHPNRFQ